MRASKDTAGHALAKGNEKEKAKQKSIAALELAKKQQAAKTGTWIYNTEKRAHIFQPH